MSAAVRTTIVTAIVTAIEHATGNATGNSGGWTSPPPMPVLTENARTGAMPAGDNDGAALASLADGYVRVRVQTQAPATVLMGRQGPRNGMIAVRIAVPIGAGVAAADQVIAALQSGLEYRQIDRVWCGGVELGAGVQQGPFWIVPASLDYIYWPPTE